jgi:hypothetical protein
MQIMNNLSANEWFAGLGSPAGNPHLAHLGVHLRTAYQAILSEPASGQRKLARPPRFPNTPIAHCTGNARVPCNHGRDVPAEAIKVSQTADLAWGSPVAAPALQAEPRPLGSGYRSRRPSEDSVVVARFALAAFMFLAGLPAMLSFCWLREIQTFWMNEGGYPVWLREVVLDAYYPLLFLNFFAMMSYVALLLRVPPRSQLSLRLNVLVLSLMGAALTFAAIYSVADNVMVIFL